jgi:hypothetical protein
MGLDCDANSVVSNGTTIQPGTPEGPAPSSSAQGSKDQSNLSSSNRSGSEAQPEDLAEVLKHYKWAAQDFYDPAMKLSVVNVSGKSVGYVKGAVYKKTTWVLVMVMFPTETSKDGCWVLKGPYVEAEHRRDMVSQVSACMTQNTQQDTSARSFFTRFMSSLTPEEGEIFWNHLDHEDSSDPDLDL